MAFKDHLTVKNIVILILFIIGLWWLIVSLTRNRKIDQIASWPKTDAIVINSVIESETTKYKKSQTYDNTDTIDVETSTNTRYHPKVLYRYNIDGKEYESTSDFYGGDQWYNALDIKTIMSTFTPGTTIRIFYNPKNASESYIYNGTKSYTGLVISILLLLLALILALHEKMTGNKTTTYKQTTTTTAVNKNLQLL